MPGASDLSGNHSHIHSFNSAQYSSSSSACGESFQIKLSETMIFFAMTNVATKNLLAIDKGMNETYHLATY